MRKTPATHQAERPTRRDALRRLAGAALVGYVIPEVLFLSAARADDDGPSAPKVSAPSPHPPSPSGGPDPEDTHDPEDTEDTHEPEDTSDSESTANNDDKPDDDAADDRARDTCNLPRARGSNSISISRSDLERAQEAVTQGYAQPLDKIWGRFKSGYDGNVLGVEFLDRQRNPRYRFRAISRSGRLETVTISAQTGIIQQIVGC